MEEIQNKTYWNGGNKSEEELEMEWYNKYAHLLLEDEFPKDSDEDDVS